MSFQAGIEELFATDERPWNIPEWKSYYYKNAHEDILASGGRWFLEPLGLYDEVSGLTSNAAETLNSKLKAMKTNIHLANETHAVIALKCFNDE